MSVIRLPEVITSLIPLKKMLSIKVFDVRVSWECDIGNKIM